MEEIDPPEGEKQDETLAKFIVVHGNGAAIKATRVTSDTPHHAAEAITNSTGDAFYHVYEDEGQDAVTYDGEAYVVQDL